MSRVNRETVRDALAALLDTALVDGTPKLAQAVYSYQKADWGSLSPVVLVYSDGAARPIATYAGGKSSLYLAVGVFVAITATGGYTEATAENRLDAIEVKIAETLTANRVNEGVWYFIDYEDRSYVEDVSIGGVPYINENIPIRVDVFS